MALKRVKTITFKGAAYNLKVTIEVSPAMLGITRDELDREVTSTTDDLFKALVGRRSPSKLKVRNGR